jgi:hypothetical protein
MQAMTTAILKQVLVTLVRPSLNSTSVWLERFSIRSDRQFALAFADMVARPSANHSVMAPAEKAAHVSTQPGCHPGRTGRVVGRQTRRDGVRRHHVGDAGGTRRHA